MKWGVRRYQNYDGSYTAAGLKKYRTYESATNRAKDNYKNSRNLSNHIAYRKALNEQKKAYKNLQNDYRADKGKELYASGKRITTNKTGLKVGAAAISIGTALAYKAAQSDERTMITKSCKTVPMKDLESKAVVGIGAAALAGLGIKYMQAKSENRNLSAFYGHKSWKAKEEP